MSQAVANAIWHASYRSAFQKHLIDKPLKRKVIADLVIELEAASALTFRFASAFDRKPHDEPEQLFARIVTPIAKYWLNKRVVKLVFEAMEVLGEGCYIEDTVISSLYGQAPVNSIWEGSLNVICLDVLRVLYSEPATIEMVCGELAKARGTNVHFDAAL